MKVDLSDKEIEFILEAMQYGKLRFEEIIKPEDYASHKQYSQKKQEILGKYSQIMNKLKEAIQSYI